jgi:two-component system chemotaxis response regulator CheB
MSAIPASRPRVIGVCASAGGPTALRELLAGLPAGFPTPVLVVQHIAIGFAEGLARLLDGDVALPVAIAQDGAPLLHGVWLAADDADMTVTPDLRIKLDHESAPARYRPSGDRLLASLALAVGDRAVGVVMSGMGRDGAEGTAAIKEGGGLALAQDEATARVYMMPGAAVEAGARPLPPGRIAEVLRDLDRAPAR